MNEQRTIETLMTEEFERIVEQFIAKAAVWDGALPAEALFATWDELVEDAPPLEVQAMLVGNELILEAAPESPLTARGNRIRLEDGRELVISFRSFASAARGKVF
jgi:hypothetical protein